MRAVGIILAGGNNNKMRELTQRRAVAAMPIAGSYRAIDFALSNMSNSHIQKVAVLTQYNARSLNEHLNSSKWWDFGRKQGGLYVFTPTITADNGYWYRGTADAIYQNLEFLKRCHEPYVIITSGDAVYKMDYNKVLEYHIAKKADITVVCRDLDQGEDATRFGILKMNENMRIEDFEEKPMVANSNTISTGIYIIRRRQLIDLIEHSAEEDRYDFVTDILIRYKNLKKIYGYKIKDYWSNISTVDAYYKTNMDFLKPEVRNYFFKQLPSIYSKVTDLPPANIRCVLLPLPHCGTVHIPLMYKKDDHDLCCRQRPLFDSPSSLILVPFQKVCLALLPAQEQKTYRTSAEYQSLLFQYILMEFQDGKRTQALRVCSLPASSPV